MRFLFSSSWLCSPYWTGRGCRIIESMIVNLTIWDFTYLCCRWPMTSSSRTRDCRSWRTHWTSCILPFQANWDHIHIGLPQTKTTTTSTSIATWHRPHFFCKDSWSHIYQSPFGLSACSQLVRPHLYALKLLWAHEMCEGALSNYSELWSFPKSAMPQVLGGVLHQPPRDNTWRLSSVAVCTAVCVLQNFLIWLNFLKQQMINFPAHPSGQPYSV